MILMRVKYFLSILLLAVLVQLNAQKEITYSDLADSSIVADGDVSDWRQPFRYYDGALKLEFSIRNNAEYFFLCLRTSDDMTQMRMLNAGLEFTVNTGKKTYATIIFPLQRDHNSAQPGEFLTRDKQQHIDRTQIKRLMVSEIKTMKLKGFKGLPDGIYGIQTPEGIKAGMGIDSTGALVAEYQVPFKLLFVQADTLKPFSATLTLNRMEMPAGMPPPGGGGMPGPPPGMGSGGMQGPPAGMGGGGMGAGGGMSGGDFGDGGSMGMGGTGMPGGGGAGRMGGGQNGPPPGYGFSNENAQDKTIKMKIKLAAW
jgi:hypothetical protein